MTFIFFIYQIIIIIVIFVFRKKIRFNWIKSGKTMKRMYQQPSIQTTEIIYTAQVLCASGWPSLTPKLEVDTGGEPQGGVPAW